MKNYICDVIDRYIKHDYPEEVNQDFRTWLTDEERADEKEHELNKLWEATEAVTTPGYRDSLERMHELTGIGSRRRIYSLRTRLVVWRVAAALLITVSSISIYLALQNRQAPDLLQAYIPTAETRNITLPDGTQVLINSQSTLLYPQQFTGDTRCVYLVGEANFKVKRDEEHPFIVKSSDFQVTALGTEFNVTAYPDEDEVTATLISGKVLVEYNGQKNQEVLNPNEQLAYNKRTRSGNVVRPDMQDITAWQRGEIVFRSMTLEEIFTRLERKYRIQLVYIFLGIYHYIQVSKPCWRTFFREHYIKYKRIFPMLIPSISACFIILRCIQHNSRNKFAVVQHRLNSASCKQYSFFVVPVNDLHLVACIDVLIIDIL